MKRNPQTTTLTFWALARNYLNNYVPKVRAMSAKTVETYRICLQCYINYLVENTDIERKDITFDHFERTIIKDWLVWMRQIKEYKPATVALRLSAIKAFLKYASQEDITLMALHEGVKTIKAPSLPRKPIEYLEDVETKAILSAFSGASAKSRRNRMMLILLYDTAARVSELTNLTLSDMKLAKPAHVILTGKRNKSRVVPIGDKTVEHLEVYLREFHPKQAKLQGRRPLFYRYHQGEPTCLSPDTIQLVLKKAGQIANEYCSTIPSNLHCHMLRKTKAMDLYKQGVPLPLIMQLLGHESMSTTSAFYAFATLDMMRQAMNAANANINPPGQQWLSEEQLQSLYTLR